MSEVIFTVDRETFEKLRDLSYLVVLDVQFNTDTQVYEVLLRNAGWTDT